MLRRTFEELTAGQLYALLRLRVDIFVVEQQCAYPELDGRDAHRGTTHYWADLDGVPVATLRVLRDAALTTIGRVATAADHRGRGYAAVLMRAAIDDVGAGDIGLEAQRHLHDWYAGFGFARAGEDYVEDGIPHLPMLRPTGSQEQKVCTQRDSQ